MGQVIWAVDLKLNYSDSMTMSRLMQYVTGGSFSPQLSVFEVPVRKKREISGRRRRRRVVEEEEEVSVHLSMAMYLQFVSDFSFTVRFVLMPRK